MVPNGLREELRGTWGPPPNGPEQKVIWEETMNLIASIPQLLAQTIQRDGTPFDSLLSDLGSLETLADIGARCVERYLCKRKVETIDEVVRETIQLPPWNDRLKSLSPVRKTRMVQRLGEELANKLAVVVFGNVKLRDWFFANQ